jgi:DMSO/TMAO reductase YedYZ molybdopterin-dependent catalytic subunit
MPIESGSLSRRNLGRLVGAAALAPVVARTLFAPGTALAAGAEDSAAIYHGKKAGMIVHNAKLGVMETPLAELRNFKHTPKDILYTRFHFPHEGESAWYATTAAPSFKDWTITIDGQVARPRTVHLADLAGRAQEKRVMVLQCAGNGRAYYAARKKVPGGQWHNGGMGNVEWEGVPLRPFLDDMKLMPGKDAIWLTAHGWDHPATFEGTGFAKSYRLADPALDHAILALKMNGEPIPAAHGGPVRLIIPGFYGNMNVKMVTTMLFEAAQSPSVYQSVGYRMPLVPVTPETFKFGDYTTENSRPTYGQPIKSVIFTPLPEDKPKSGAVTVTGIAFNDGTAPITSVEVTADGGKTWHKASIAAPESPWAWHHWSAKLNLGAGTHTLAARATDALGRGQPMDGLERWNPRGYEWNGVEKIDVAFS